MHSYCLNTIIDYIPCSNKWNSGTYSLYNDFVSCTVTIYIGSRYYLLMLKMCRIYVLQLLINIATTILFLKTLQKKEPFVKA